MRCGDGGIVRSYVFSDSELLLLVAADTRKIAASSAFTTGVTSIDSSDGAEVEIAQPVVP
jgi:hypothetical protein